MDAKEYLKTQVESMWYLQDSTCKDVGDDILMSTPPGTISPIGLIWLHLVNAQDNFVAIITGKASLWETGDWHEQFGIEKAPDMGEDWDQYKAARLTVELLNKYNAAVRQHTKTVLDITSADSLDESVKFFSDSDPKANVWALMVGHTMLHCGEIAALKGTLGRKGLPF
jgi:hypothetical protein